MYYSEIPDGGGVKLDFEGELPFTCAVC